MFNPFGRSMDNANLNRSWNNMNLNFVKNYLRVEIDFTEDDLEIELFMLVAKQYIMHVCDMTEEDLQKEDKLIPAFLILVSELYEQRSSNIPSNSKVNLVLYRYLNTCRKFI